MIPYLIAVAILGLSLFAHLRFNLFQKEQHGLPILQYDQISDNSIDSGTVNLINFERQLQYLVAQKYSTVTITELLAGQTLPENPIIITIDQGKSLGLDKVMVLLEKYNLHAVLFIPIGYIGEKLDWNDKPALFLDREQIRNIDQSRMEIGINSYFYISFNSLSEDEIKEDITSCVKYEDNNELGLLPIIAYPQRNDTDKNYSDKFLRKVLEENKIRYSLKRGNRINPLPINDNYGLYRIEIKGNDRLIDFKIKLRKGKSKLW